METAERVKKMANGEAYRLLELLGPMAQNDPKIKGLRAALSLNPKMSDTVIKLLRSMVRQAGIDLSDPAAFPVVTQLPEGGARVGTVITGIRDGPIFHVAEGSASDLENVGLFGLPRWGKTCILMQIARHTMLNGNLAWMFDVEDEFSCLIDAVPEPYKPVVITPEHLRINLYQPPGDWIKLKSWMEAIAFLLRSETFIRDGAQNLFNASLRRLLKNKGAFAGSGQYTSLAETLCYFQGLRLGGSEVRGKTWLESLVNRITMLCDTYEETCHVTGSDMLELLVNKSVIFRLQNMRKTPLQFLTNFLLMWLATYRQGAANTEKLQTLFLDEQHLFRADKSRIDIGSATLENLFATGAKRGLRTVLSNQLISKLDEQILGTLGCRIITRLTNPRCMLLIQQSMALSHAQAASITKLEKREVIVAYGDHPTPFKVRVDELSFPPKPDEMALEKIAQDFLDKVTWKEDAGLESNPVEPDTITSDVLKVFARIAEKAENIEERSQSLNIDRACEVRARKVLEAKGFIKEEKVTLARLKFYEISIKGKQWIDRQKQKGLHIKIKHCKSGQAHEYLLEQAEKNIGSLNPQFKFQRNSEIAREHGIQPDLVLIQPLGYRTIIEIICYNVDREARILVKERGIAGVDMVIAIVPNQPMKKALQRAVDRCQTKESDADLASLVILDAGTCLSPKFDWVSVFERP